MPLLTPDPTFYPSPAMAMQSPPEQLAYLALINPRKDGRPDAIGVVDVDPESKGYGRLVGQTPLVVFGPSWASGAVAAGSSRCHTIRCGTGISIPS